MGAPSNLPFPAETAKMKIFFAGSSPLNRNRRQKCEENSGKTHVPSRFVRPRRTSTGRDKIYAPVGRIIEITGDPRNFDYRRQSI